MTINTHATITNTHKTIRTAILFKKNLIPGEAFRKAGISIKYIYSSPSLRCIQTAQGVVDGECCEKKSKHINIYS